MLLSLAFTTSFVYFTYTLLTEKRHTLQNTPPVLLMAGVFLTSTPEATVQDWVSSFLSPTPTYNQAPR